MRHSISQCCCHQVNTGLSDSLGIFNRNRSREYIGKEEWCWDNYRWEQIRTSLMLISGRQVGWKHVYLDYMREKISNTSGFFFPPVLGGSRCMFHSSVSPLPSVSRYALLALGGAHYTSAYSNEYSINVTARNDQWRRRTRKNNFQTSSFSIEECEESRNAS